ncbi:MAG TPA: cyclase family protein [Acidimicrobiia bacterium]|nr:cyclase family protein [Acidimicrobiia bacterium]
MIIDISRSIGPDTPVWPGDPPVVVEPVARVAAGDPADVSRLQLGTHTGTHVDPPAHFFPGATTVDALPLDVLVGPAVVADFSGGGPIDAGRLESQALPAGTTRLLLRTGAAGGAVTADGARWLVERGVRLVGADTLSIEAGEAPECASGEAGEAPEYPVHRVLLAAGVVIVEGLDLSAAGAGRYQLVCLPLRITGGDGAPARAVLIPAGDATS